MRMDPILRRELLTLPLAAWLAEAAEEGDQPIPFLDTKPFSPERPTMPWDQLESWITPTEHLFRVAHYGYPEVDPKNWSLDIKGLVERPRSYSLEELQKRRSREHTVTIECSGNGPVGGLVGNVKWTGTPLVPLLKECGVKPEGVEVVFFAADQGVEKIRNGEYPQHFARSLAVRDAMRDNILLCWALNGQPLDKNHGAPLRLVVPGWYGVAWVKWLTRIEVHDRAFLSRFMGRDYVTIRGEKQGDKTIWRETSVGRMNLKSVAARVIKRKDGSYRVMGAAWSDGTPIQRVEMKVDDRSWMPANLVKSNAPPYCWVFWTFDWKDVQPGEHTVASRATDARGRVQPAPEDPSITMKKTYWEANQQAVRKIKI
jgi:DMSO/TMAO reductase YedYZ molybdopterin-dependent catalytic subunit